MQKIKYLWCLIVRHRWFWEWVAGCTVADHGPCIRCGKRIEKEK